MQRVEEHVFRAAEGLCSLRRQARSWISHTSTAHAQSPKRLLQLEAKYQTAIIHSVMCTVASASREMWQRTSKDVPSLYDGYVVQLPNSPYLARIRWTSSSTSCSCN